jgi:hypothetical protein
MGQGLWEGGVERREVQIGARKTARAQDGGR